MSKIAKMLARANGMIAKGQALMKKAAELAGGDEGAAAPARKTAPAKKVGKPAAKKVAPPAAKKAAKKTAPAKKGPPPKKGKVAPTKGKPPVKGKKRAVDDDDFPAP